MLSTDELKGPNKGLFTSNDASIKLFDKSVSTMTEHNVSQWRKQKDYKKQIY